MKKDTYILTHTYTCTLKFQSFFQTEEEAAKSERDTYMHICSHTHTCTLKFQSFFQTEEEAAVREREVLTHTCMYVKVSKFFSDKQ